MYILNFKNILVTMILLTTFSLNAIAEELASSSERIMSKDTSQAEQLDLNDEVYKLNIELRKISNKIEATSERANLNWRYIKKGWNAYDENISKRNEVDTALEGIYKTKEQLKLHLTELESKSEELDLLIERNSQVINNVESNTSTKFKYLNNQNQQLIEKTNIDKNDIYWIVFIASILLFSFITFVYKNSRARSFSFTDQLAQTNSAQHKLEEASVELDLRLIELLNKQVNLEKELSINETNDHSFMLSVSEEITRMQKNIDRLSGKVKGTKPLSKGIERIKISMEESGYELVELLGTQYVEQMNIDVENIVENEDFPKGSQTITKVIRPQVSFDGKLIQRAKVEVSVN